MQVDSEVPYVEWDEFLRGFRWKQGEHMTLLGPTGQGKSTLARLLIDKYRDYVCVFVTKARDPLIHEMGRDGYEEMSEFISNKHVATRVLLRPGLKDASNKSIANQAEAFRKALNTIFIAGAWAVFLDEAEYVCHDLRLNRQVSLLLQQGRTLGVTVISLTQRPVNVPLKMYNQATHLFFWRENDDANLKRLGGLGGNSRDAIRSAVSMLSSHEVLYLNTRTGTMVRTKARL